VAEFVQYNYNVDPDCDNLVIGQYVRVHRRKMKRGLADQLPFGLFYQYCVLIGSIILDECYPGNTNPLCQQ
jgi:hypothetical protein